MMYLERSWLTKAIKASSGEFNSSNGVVRSAVGNGLNLAEVLFAWSMGLRRALLTGSMTALSGNASTVRLQASTFTSEVVERVV